MRVDPLSPPPLCLAMTLHGRHDLFLRSPLLGHTNRSLHELALFTIEHQRPTSRNAVDPTKIARERIEQVEVVGPTWKTRAGSVQSHVKFRSFLVLVLVLVLSVSLCSASFVFQERNRRRPGGRVAGANQKGSFARGKFCRLLVLHLNITPFTQEDNACGLLWRSRGRSRRGRSVRKYQIFLPFGLELQHIEVVCVYARWFWGTGQSFRSSN